MSNNKNSVEFNDLEGANFSITYMPKFNQFSVSITDSCGRSTNSISIGYEDLRSIFKEAENMFFKNMDIVRDERSIPKTKYRPVRKKG